MAVELLLSGSDRVDFGDVSQIAGATALSIALRLKPAGSLSGRLATQWGSNDPARAFIFQAGASGDVRFLVSPGGGSSTWLGKLTDNAVFSSGVQSGVVGTWSASSGSLELFHNGTNEAVSEWIASGSPASIANPSTSIQVGHETHSSSNGKDGDFSEFALWTIKLPEDFAKAISNGASPLIYPRGLVLYSRMANTDDIDDIVNGYTGTLTGGANAKHPPVIYPASPMVMPWVTGAAPTGTILPFMQHYAA